MDNGYPPEAWKRLGRRLTDRRAELGYGFRQRRQFWESRADRPLSLKTLERVERAERTGYPPETLATLDRIYEYRPGSVEAILRGGSPVPAPGTPGAAASVQEERDPAPPGGGSLSSDAALIFPDDPAAQTLLVRAVADIHTLRELAGWITWQRKVAVEGFPEEDLRRDATGLPRELGNCSHTMPHAIAPSRAR